MFEHHMCSQTKTDEKDMEKAIVILLDCTK